MPSVGDKSIDDFDWLIKKMAPAIENVNSTLVTSFQNNQILCMLSRNDGIKVNPRL